MTAAFALVKFNRTVVMWLLYYFSCIVMAMHESIN